MNDTFAEQLIHPDHCYLERGGDLWRHDRNDLDNPLRGRPIRFTRLAARRLIEQMPWLGMVEIE